MTNTRTLEACIQVIERSLGYPTNPRKGTDGIIYYQIDTGFVHDDTDPYELFIAEKDGNIIITDCSMTTIRISCDWPAYAENWEHSEAVPRVIRINGFQFNENSGEIYRLLDNPLKDVRAAVIAMITTIAQVTALSYID